MQYIGYLRPKILIPKSSRYKDIQGRREDCDVDSHNNDTSLKLLIIVYSALRNVWIGANS